MADRNIPTNPAQLGGTEWVKITIPLTALAVAVVCGRVVWRWSQAGKLARADYSIIAAACMAIIQEVLGCIAILKWGFGHHGAYLGMYRMRKSLMYFYLYQIPYKILVSLTKMSFLFLYLDIFVIPWFQKVVWVVQGSVIAALIAFTLTTTFQCTPIEYNWNKSIKGGHCIDPPVFWYAHAVWNTAFDIIILLLPIPVIKSLQMARNQKAALLAVFALGTFVCVTSIMRMITLDIAAKSTVSDLTYKTGSAFTWTQVESCVGIICCCLPMLKAVLTRFLPTIFARSTHKESSNSFQLNYIHDQRLAQQPKPWEAKRNYQSRADFDAEASSQEEIFGMSGIKRTIDVSVKRLQN